MTGPGRQLLQATTVAVDGRALLILGPSGSGKSGLALALLGLGAVLVADDQTEISLEADALVARCPNPDLRGLIEARGLGILRAPFVDRAELALVIDLSQPETERLPPRREITILGKRLPLVLQVQNAHVAPALMLYLRHGREA